MRAQYTPFLAWAILLIANSAWSASPNPVLVVSRQRADVYVLTFGKDGASSATKRNTNEPIMPKPECELEDALYDPSHRKLYVENVWDSMLYELDMDLSRSLAEYQTVPGIRPSSRQLLYDSQKQALVVTDIELANEPNQDNPSVKSWNLLCYKGNGNWEQYDPSSGRLNLPVRKIVRPEFLSVIGGRSEDELLSTWPEVRRNLPADRGAGMWRLVSQSRGIRLYLLLRSRSNEKPGDLIRDYGYLILDDAANCAKFFLAPVSGTGVAFNRCVAIMESRRYYRQTGYRDDKKLRTGIWHLYYSGSERIHKTEIPPDYELMAADDENDLLYFASERDLYRVRVSAQGWGQLVKVTTLPANPGWLFVVQTNH